MKDKVKIELGKGKDGGIAALVNSYAPKNLMDWRSIRLWGKITL
jgi:hypothetical protein